MNSPKLPPLTLPQGLPNAWAIDCAVFAEAIRPDPDLSVWEWADRYRVLSADIASEPGPWRTDRVPAVRKVMQVLSPVDATQEVTFVAGSQNGKTETGNNFLGYIIDQAPGPVMMVMPTSNTGKRSSRTRLARMIEATPRLRAKISDRSRDNANSMTMKDFPGGVLVIAGANSAAELKSMPVRYLFMDEVDEYPDDVDGQGPADELAEKRTDTYKIRRKIFRTSTPTEGGRSKIWRHWLRSDQRRYHLACPHCAHRQVLVWEQFRWETRRVWEITRTDDGEIVEVPEGTEGATERDTGELLDLWYECAACAARIEEHHKTAMLAGGVWIADNPASPRAGFHLPAFYSPLGWFSWREAVEQRLEADKDPTGQLLKVWTNTVKAEPYYARAESVSDIALRQRAEDYRLQAVPAGGLFLTAAADVQGDRIEALVKAWGRGEESWLVDYQVLYGDTEQPQVWAEFDLYLQRTFLHEWGVPMRILAAAVDSGYRTQTVYAFCAPRTHRHVIAVKGQSQSGKTVLGRPQPVEINHRGQKIPHGAQLWPVGADTAKGKIFARLAITQPGPGAMHFPHGLPEEYYGQLTAERVVTKYVRGYPRRVWEKDPAKRNEALDLEVYAYAAAIYAGLTRTQWDRLEAALKASAGDLFVQAEARAGAAATAKVHTSGRPPAARAPAAGNAASDGAGATGSDGDGDAAAAASGVAASAAAVATPASVAAGTARPGARRGNWVTGFRG